MFNNTEFSTLEVKFTQADLLEESKKKAIETYEENNKCLGLIFNSGLEAYEEYSDLDEDCLPELPGFNKSEEIRELNTTFKECLNLIRNGDIEKASELGTNTGIFDAQHPLISFLHANQAARKSKLAQSKNLLPWTSADSITIFPL